MDCKKRDIPDFTKSDGTGAEPVGLLDTTSGVLNTRNTRQGESQVVTERGPKGEGGEKPHLPQRSSLQPWWRAAYEGLFLGHAKIYEHVCEKC